MRQASGSARASSGATSTIPQLWLHVAAINPRTDQTQLLDGPAFAIAIERLRLAGYDHIVVDARRCSARADINARDLRRAIEQLGTSKVAGAVLLQDR